MVTVINTNESNFQEEVLDAAKPVLVDFWAPWCGYCTRLAPIMDELAQELGDQIKVVKINVDENRSLAQRYGIMSLPTMVVFKDGELVEKLTGYMPKASIAAKVEQLM